MRNLFKRSRVKASIQTIVFWLSLSLSARSPGRPMTNTNLDKDTKFQSGMFKEDPGKHLRSESQIHLKSTKLPPKYIQSYAHMRGLSINFCEGYPSRRMIKHIFLCLLWYSKISQQRIRISLNAAPTKKQPLQKKALLLITIPSALFISAFSKKFKICSSMKVKSLVI